MMNFKESETVEEEIKEDAEVEEYDYMNEEPLEEDEGYIEKEHDYCG